MNQPKTRLLELTDEEAYALLSLALTSPNQLDIASETAIHKLAQFCSRRNSIRAHHTPVGELELKSAVL